MDKLEINIKDLDTLIEVENFLMEKVDNDVDNDLYFRYWNIITSLKIQKSYNELKK